MKKRYVIAAIVILAILTALSMPASALVGRVPIDQLNRFEVAVPNGSFTVRWTPNPSPFTFYVPDETLYWVGIYDSVWMPNDPIHASYNGHTLPDSSPDNSLNTRLTGLGTCGVWFDNETGNTTQGAYNTYQSWNWNNAHGVGVPIVYIEPANPNTLYYWFYQGYDDADAYSGCNGYYYCMDYTFHNVTASAATHWTLMVAVTCADNGNILFNGNGPLPDGYNASTKFYHVAINNVTGMVQNGDNVVRLRTNDGYFHPYWMWLVGYTPVQLEPDLTVIDIEAGTPRPNHDFTVNATILNQGNADAGPFNVSLYVDDVVNGTEPVSGLGAGNSTIVSFTGVNLPEDCYEFKVVADVYDEVGESNEYNNETSEDYQVGYVIDVRSDSDFVDLLNDPGMPSGSVTYDSGTDTYYIQNLTITNCAGEGIYTVDTSKNFVINNCTIEDCKPKASGVFLNNVTKGTITGCTLRNNTAYGVELGLVPLSAEDPQFINITCNTFYNNSYGIELIGFNSTVKGNLIQNNTIYGVYVYGNDSVIYNNTIENNANYGIKLYNSSGNYVYWNDLTNNNGGGVQAYDNRATNHWSTSTQVSYCYNGGTYTNYTGNYWDDYTTPDSNGDGIVDTPYDIDPTGAAKDYYPLVVPWRLCGDVNRDGNVTMGDALAVRNYRGFGYSLCNPWAGDVNCDDDITMGDALAIRNYRGFGYPLNNCCKGCQQ